jgi:hypothetical protein
MTEIMHISELENLEIDTSGSGVTERKPRVSKPDYKDIEDRMHNFKPGEEREYCRFLAKNTNLSREQIATITGLKVRVVDAHRSHVTMGTYDDVAFPEVFYEMLKLEKDIIGVSEGDLRDLTT